jgi:hypothetical protein
VDLISLFEILTLGLQHKEQIGFALQPAPIATAMW